MLTRTLTLIVSTCLVGTALYGAETSFVGKWKLNPEKSKYSGVQHKIEDLGGDKLQFTFGDDVETIAADGKDHPSKWGGMWSITKTGPNSWKSVRTHDGKVSSTSLWTLSDDGKTYTSTTDGTRVDGSTYKNTFTAKRVSGGPGLAGTWESTDLKIGSPTVWEIAAYEGDGLSFIRPAGKARLDFKFDGKEYADKGPRVAEGTTVSAKRIDEGIIELTYKLNGKLVSTDRMKLSDDAKTLTTTVTFPGVAKEEIEVHDRQ